MTGTKRGNKQVLLKIFGVQVWDHVSANSLPLLLTTQNCRVLTHHTKVYGILQVYVCMCICCVIRGEPKTRSSSFLIFLLLFLTLLPLLSIHVCQLVEPWSPCSKIVKVLLVVIGSYSSIEKITLLHTMKMAVFWLVALCNLVEVYRYFRSFCYFHQEAFKSQQDFQDTSFNNVQMSVL